MNLASRIDPAAPAPDAGGARPWVPDAVLPLAPGARRQVDVASAGVASSRIVVVDDEPVVLEMLSLHLEDAGYRDVVALTDSSRAMDLVRVSPPDLLLTNLRMPGVTGFELLAEIRNDPRLAHIPVIMLTSSADPQTRLEALELGATDFLAKPVDPSELALRVRNNLSVKAYQDQLAASRRESDGLLLSILPEAVAERLKRGEAIADHYEAATVLFADLVDFTGFAARADAATVVECLNEVFHAFDQIVDSRRLEKIKTIGDAYMLAGGVPTPRPDHAEAVVDAGLAMVRACERLAAQGRSHFRVRIGVHSGPVVAGVIGKRRFAYDLWGDTVNVASRMESTGVIDRVQVSEATRGMLEGAYRLEPRGAIQVKGKGAMHTSLVVGRRD